MTWVTFVRDYRHSTVRYTEYFKDGEVRNLPRHTADSIVKNGGAVKGGKSIEKQGQDKT